MRAIHETDLGWLLGRLGDKPSGVGPKAVYQVVTRWETEGLAKSKRYPWGGPGRPPKTGRTYETPSGGRYVEVTQKGCDLLGIERPDGKTERVTPVALTRLRHTVMCARVRLFYEAQGFEWISERSILRDGWRLLMDDGTEERREWTSHRPDGVALRAGEALGVEVELASKEPVRLQRIIADLMSDERIHSGAHYWADGATLADQVRRAVAEVEQAKAGGAAVPRVGRGWQGPVSVYDLSDLGAFMKDQAPAHLRVPTTKDAKASLSGRE